ncbi:MAG: hypothetical protein HY297_05120 [Thaumarchaeota archaeon]|nr:hypothetical protein [Nitrososphaerota archaeon]
MALLGLLVFTTSSLPIPFSRAIASPAQSCAENPSNPILPDSEPYTAHAFDGSPYTAYQSEYDYASVLREGAGYRMWFSGKFHNVSGIFTASSPDGLAWTVRDAPVLTLGPNGTWDDNAIYSPSVVWNGSMYLMYYTGSGTSAFRETGLAYSADNVDWVRYPQNPILTPGPGEYDAYWGRFANVVKEGDAYRMWYTGHTNYGITVGNATGFYVAVDYANSTDGVHWTKYEGNPVFGGYDWFVSGGGYSHPSVLKVEGSYLMVLDNYYQITFATSHDGLSWSGNNSPLLSISGSPNWVNGSLWGATTLVNGSQLLIWYRGFGVRNDTGAQVAGIAFAKCSLIVLTSEVTSTKHLVVTDRTTSTSVSVLTTTSVSVTKETLPDALGSPAGLVVVVGVLAGGAALGAAALYLLRRPRPTP